MNGTGMSSRFTADLNGIVPREHVAYFAVDLRLSRNRLVQYCNPLSTGELFSRRFL